MLESIYIGMTGLSGYSNGLRVIANDTANLNTPGFKGSNLQFANLFSAGDNASGNASGAGDSAGFGLTTTGTVLNFRQGEMRQTNNDLDVAVNGQGLFIVKDSSGNLHYTRAGQFEFNGDGILVNRADGAKVMALGANGSLTEISIASLKTNAGKATGTVAFGGNLSSTATDQTIGGVTVFDAAGGQHDLSVKFTNTGSTTAGSWSIAVLDGSTTVATGQIIFSNGSPTAATSKMSFNYNPAGQAAIPVTLDFSTSVTSFASGNLSTLAMTSQDGFSPAALTKTTFDSTGTLILTYANGQTVKGPRLGLGRFDSTDAIASSGANEFDAVDPTEWHIGYASTGAFGSINAGMVEVSNVDLSQEFSDLVIMQRGYQAASQIVSTANDMLQELFTMKSK
jgi:flagellar hook protein FlgE